MFREGPVGAIHAPRLRLHLSASSVLASSRYTLPFASSSKNLNTSSWSFLVFIFFCPLLTSCKEGNMFVVGESTVMDISNLNSPKIRGFSCLFAGF